MPMPGTEEMSKPLLEAFRGEAPRNYSNSEMLEIVAEHFGLNLNDFSSADKNVIKSRINAAKQELIKEGLLYNLTGNTYMITKAGMEVLSDGLSEGAREIKYNEQEGQPQYTNIEPEGLMHDSDITLDEPDTLTQDSDIVLDEPETLTQDSDIALDEPEALPQDSDIRIDEPDTLTQDSDIALDEPDTLTQDSDIALDEPETLTQDSDIRIDDTETLTHDSDITLDEHEALPDNKPEPENYSGIEPDETLHTEEVHSNIMPDEIFSPDEPQEPHDNITLDDPEPEHDDYDPTLVAQAMSSGSIDDVIAQHNSELAEQLLMKVAGLPSDRFEMLVIDLLSKMGYFAFQTARYTTEASGSNLIHGVILDNKTGANIYIQARKLSPGRTIGKSDIQEFIDELSDKGGKGIYATTANFSENAKILANDERLMLIDGERLSTLMIANNFCVNVEKVYEIKSLDEESFSEYE